MPPLLEIRGIHHRYGEQKAVRQLSLTLDMGQIGCLLGPSGCGKTTVLRCIAGFEPVSDGTILLNGTEVSTKDFCVPPERRHVGMVFQDYALFPHLTVAANIGFGLHRMEKSARAARVAELLQTVGLTDTATRYPHELSGGQQQRVALARALAPRPDLLLLDEPFSNLDVTLRERLSLEVRDILRQQNATAMLVTHDQDEAFAMADRIGVMQAGEIRQWDTAYNLYHRPANRFVAEFIGQGVFLAGRILDADHVEIDLGTLKGRVQHACAPDCTPCTDHPVDVLIRPDDIVHDDASPLQAEVLHKAFRGADILYTLRLPGGAVALSLIPSHHDHAIGGTIGIRLEVDHVVAFNRTAP
ncbi:ABC transporter ATP-binding protein [Nitrosovibrio sp. Nv17]|uniref:ABC transporter ATP-binding protein n=1 Tax=Nitrosovibrio sp. Nv17 TaxID=1855339 RepID=UPI0009089AA0|nr:ABC transporter ATP-binding protein [Nitrosovibrio sp. Nv17]SFW25148.1 iron(III) transport system ATP-binding protein [Nitrosovibrio sp. Nv17]